MDRRNIEFPTVDGVTLRGHFYPARGQGTIQKAPCIIMAHGIRLTGLKEHFLPDFADRFQAAGYGVIAYDHRNWGASDGLPRYETNPIQQGLDLSDAFDFALSLPEVDGTKIAYWGSSMSGGAALYAAALDHRICAVIAQVPFVSGETIAPHFAPLLPSLYSSLQEAKAGKKVDLLKMFTTDPEAAMKEDPSSLINDPNIAGFLKEFKDDNFPFYPYITPQTLFNMVAFEPLAYAGADRCAPAFPQLKAYQQALEPKRLALLQDKGHFDPYYGETFEDNIKAPLAFLKEFL
ncbi:alpha/beta-hydrolase [Periconia macrospinosa]|uniref:Alpha/beta-hydrolase n=1 Tax=Periconia macrospinosa TaxID=97972 RepID=A0A2V1DKB8_9PLEO|nr:alpha/beta-hydrolase [Periconia macrospinosa]